MVFFLLGPPHMTNTDKLELFATWEITLPEYIGAWGLSEFVKYGDFNVTLLLDGVCH